VASGLQRDRIVLERPRKGAVVDPVELQWTSAGTDGFEQAARAIPGKAGRQIRSVALVRRYWRLGSQRQRAVEAVGAMGKRMWALRRMVALDRCAGKNRLKAEDRRRLEGSLATGSGSWAKIESKCLLFGGGC
jgi:hypothetical protein